MASNIAEIQDSYSQYIVTPVIKFGLGGFNFDIDGDTDMDLSADITDHFVEDNSAVQDHIAIRPEKLVLNSQVGEQVFISDDNDLAEVQEVVRKLVILDSYLPQLSAGAEQARELAQGNFETISTDTLGNIDDLWALTKNLNPAATRQQQAYLYFKAMFEKRIPVSVQTPFGYMQDMAIEGIAATQGADSKYISSFSLTLKKIRTVSVRLVAYDPNKYQSRSTQQAAPEVNNGSTNGELTSTLRAGFDSFAGTQ